MGIFDRIAGTLDELVGDNGDTEARARDEIALARGFAERGQYDEAAARLADLARRHPRLAATGAPHATTALRLLDDAVYRAPDDPAARTARARQRLAMGDPAGALADAVAATELGAESQSGKQGRAEQQAKGGSDPDPNFQRLHSPLLQTTVCFPPASPSDDSWRCLGDVRAAGGDFEGAIEAARREAALAPGSPPFGVWLARALGAEDLAAIEEALRHGGAHEAGYDDARALVAGTPTAAQLEP